jgi:hypothetical protein
MHSEKGKFPMMAGGESVDAMIERSEVQQHAEHWDYVGVCPLWRGFCGLSCQNGPECSKRARKRFERWRAEMKMRAAAMRIGS